MSSKVLSLAQRTGGTMARSAYNVAEFPEFNQPYNTSSGATGGARKKSTRQTPTEPKKPRKKSTRQMPSEVAESTTKSRKKKDPCDPNKPKRKLSAYNMFVRDNMDKVLLLHLAPRDRMKKIAELWRSQK